MFGYPDETLTLVLEIVLEILSTVVTIPENLLLSDAEKSVLSKGLNFVPTCISKKPDEFLVKQDDLPVSKIILPVLQPMSSNVNITCTLCKKLYIGETGRRLGDRFREHLRDVEKDDKNASKPVARHFNLPNHSMQHMTVCGLSLHQGNTESRKTLEQKFIFQIGTLNPDGINERFSFN